MKMKNGLYAYRFGGFSVTDDPGTWHLTGVGTLALHDGILQDGSKQSSSITQLLCQGAAIENENYTLTGSVAETAVGEYLYKANIVFTKVVTSSSPDVQVTNGTFDLVSAGNDRYWLVATWSKDLTTGEVTDEVVSGEVVWVQELS